jgi:hypothetical protein
VRLGLQPKWLNDVVRVVKGYPHRCLILRTSSAVPQLVQARTVAWVGHRRVDPSVLSQTVMRGGVHR